MKILKQVLYCFSILSDCQNDIKKIDFKGWLLILVGTLIWSLTMIKSGIVYDFGMGFWGPNGHDGVWHISIAQSLASGTESLRQGVRMPIFSGFTLQNYHIGFDLILAALHKLTFISIHTLYFQIFPPLMALAIGLFVYLFVLSWKKDRVKAFWSTFFVYFGGSFGWIVTLLREGRLGGESIFWAQQSVSTLINPPFALSILFIFLGLNLVQKGLKKNDKKLLFVVSILFGILVQIKVYAGLLCLGGLLISGLWQMVRKRKSQLIKVFAGSLIISILVFTPLNKDVGGTLVFKPFWFLETMMANPDRLYWSKFAEAIANYKLGGVWLKLTLAYAIAFIIFWYGNVGIRLIKEVYLAELMVRKRKADWVDIFLFSIILAGILIPTFFIQFGNSWNTIQFMYYSLMFSGIFAGVVVGEWMDKTRKVKTDSMYNIMIYHTRRHVLPFLIILLTIPTSIGTVWFHYLPSRPPAKISKEELQALEFLKNQPDGVVLTIPFDKKKADAAVENPPRPLYLYESTAYVSAFSGKQTFLEDEVNLEITGYDWRERRTEVERFLITPDISEARQFLEENNISYIYWVKDLLGPVSENQNLIKKVYANDEVEIYSFIK